MKAYRPAQRPGFSLIELLVVIGIITFLAAVLAFTIPNILTSAKDAATRATLKKVGELLNKRMHAISREIQDQDKLSVGAPSYLTSSPFASVTPRDKAKVLARKDFFRRHLPMSFAEAERAPTVNTAVHTAATENAEILYYFLTNGPQFDAAPVDTDFFRSSELADTDGDGAMELIDAYGHPLRFYRWPTRLIRPAPSGNESAVQSVDGTPAYTIPLDPDFSAAVPGVSARILIAAIDPSVSAADLTAEQSVSLAKDPDDPLGQTLTRPTPTASEVADFENALHTPDTWHAPLVVSAGRDGVLGLFEPNDLTRHGHLAQPVLSAEGLEGLIDNLTNQQ